MQELHLSLTKERLKGPSPEQIIFNNQWAAVALDRYHTESTASLNLEIDGINSEITLKWNSDFSRNAMRERIDMANHGGVALAWFIMSILMEYGFVEQSEIGDGVDYRFKKSETDDDDLNFLDDFHYVEISGILEESRTNTMKGRIKDKHDQIDKGKKRDKSSSVIVTLFSKPKTVKEIH